MQKAASEQTKTPDRKQPSALADGLKNLLVPILAIVISLLVSAVIVQVSGRSPALTMKALYEGSFGTPAAFGRTIVNATPLILTGLAVALSFRAGMFNVGGEGQFFLGALTAAWLGVALPVQGIGGVAIILLFGALAGALWGAIPGYLKAVTGASEVVTTIMLNYVAIYFNSYVALKVIGAGKGFPGTAPIPLANRIAPIVKGMDAHWGFVIALVVALVIYLLLWRTSWGYELRVTGFSQSTAEYVGFHIKRNIVGAMAISGALAGLAGAIEVLAIYGKMIVPFVSGVGFSGIAVALVGQVHPAGSVLAAILLGALSAGGQKIQFVANVPNDLVQLAIGLILFTVTASRIPPLVKKYFSNLAASISSRQKAAAK